jgi:hypothetical protein
LLVEIGDLEDEIGGLAQAVSKLASRHDLGVDGDGAIHDLDDPDVSNLPPGEGDERQAVVAFDDGEPLAYSIAQGLLLDRVALQRDERCPG